MSGREKTWLGFAAAIVLIFAAGPCIAGWLSAPPDQPFSGLLVEREDGFSYLANMRLGASGEWLYQDEYAVQPHPKTPLYTVYIALGHIASLAGDARVPLATLAIVYTVFRIVFGALYLVTLYWFVGRFGDDITLRRQAWALIVAGAGLGWLMLLAGHDFGQPPLDVYLGEANTIVPLLAYPHTLLARAALLGGAMCLIRADDKTDWRFAGAAGGLWLAATLAVPFEVLIAGGLVGGWIAARWLMTRRFPWRLTWMGILAGIPGAALNGITLALMGTDPTYAAWSAQNKLPLPPAIHLLSAFGLQAVLAIPGAIILWREKSRHADLLIGWAVASPLLMLIPLPFQLRFIEGFTIPLAILAIAGLGRISAGRRHWVAVVTLFALLVPSTLLLTAGGAAAALGGFGRFSAGEAGALEWLRTHAEQGSAVLSSGEFGVIVPAAAPLRAVLGHAFETPDFEATQTAVKSLYTGQESRDAALAWVVAHHVRYVIFGPDEASWAGADTTLLVDQLGLWEVFAQGGYHIYEVRSP